MCPSVLGSRALSLAFPSAKFEQQWRAEADPALVRSGAKIMGLLMVGLVIYGWIRACFQERRFLLASDFAMETIVQKVINSFAAVGLCWCTYTISNEPRKYVKAYYSLLVFFFFLVPSMGCPPFQLQCWQTKELPPEERKKLGIFDIADCSMQGRSPTIAFLVWILVLPWILPRYPMMHLAWFWLLSIYVGWSALLFWIVVPEEQLRKPFDPTKAEVWAIEIAFRLVILGMVMAVATGKKYILEKAYRNRFLDSLTQLASTRRIYGILAFMVPQHVILPMLRDPGSTIAEYVDRVSILFVEIEEFEDFTRTLRPALVLRFLNDIFNRFDEICLSHRVTKIETWCQEYVCSVGTSPHDVDASRRSGHSLLLARLVRAGRDMLKEQGERHGLKVRFRMGVHTGPIVAGVIGSKLPRYRLFGDTINTAARMMQRSDPGTLQFGEETMKDLPRMFSATCRGEVSMKGKGQVKVYTLDSSQQRGVTKDEGRSGRNEGGSEVEPWTDAEVNAEALRFIGKMKSALSKKRKGDACGITTQFIIHQKLVDARRSQAFHRRLTMATTGIHSPIDDDEDDLQDAILDDPILLDDFPHALAGPAPAPTPPPSAASPSSPSTSAAAPVSAAAAASAAASSPKAAAAPRAAPSLAAPVAPATGHVPSEDSRQVFDAVLRFMAGSEDGDGQFWILSQRAGFTKQMTQDWVKWHHESAICKKLVPRMGMHSIMLLAHTILEGGIVLCFMFPLMNEDRSYWGGWRIRVYILSRMLTVLLLLMWWHVAAASQWIQRNRKGSQAAILISMFLVNILLALSYAALDCGDKCVKRLQKQDTLSDAALISCLECFPFVFILLYFIVARSHAFLFTQSLAFVILGLALAYVYPFNAPSDLTPGRAGELTFNTQFGIRKRMALVFVSTMAAALAHEEEQESRSRFKARMARSKTQERTETILNTLMPPLVLQELQQHEIGMPLPSHYYRHATLAQSDLCGFTNLASTKTPHEVVKLVSDLFGRFDAASDRRGVCKVETVGDAYIAGMAEKPLTVKNDPVSVVNFGQDMVDAVRDWSAALGVHVTVRVGVHHGECIGGIVGNDMQRYHIFGNIMSFIEILESTGVQSRVQVSTSCKQELERYMAEVEEAEDEPRRPGGRTAGVVLSFEERSEAYLKTSKGEVYEFNEVGGPTYLVRFDSSP